jgi:hypothetical protein
MLIAIPTWLWSIVAAFVSLHAAADGLWWDTLTDLDIRLFHNHTSFNLLPPTATELSIQHPFAIGVGELANRDDADTCLIVAALTWSKSDSPPGLIEVSLIADSEKVSNGWNLLVTGTQILSFPWHP